LAGNAGGVVRVEAEQIIRDALRISRGTEYLAIIILKSFQPATQIGCGIGDIGLYSQGRADHGGTDFHPQLFRRVRARTETPAFAYAKPAVVRGIVTQFVCCGLRESLWTFEDFSHWHLHMVGGWGVKCLSTAIANIDTAIVDDGVDGFRGLP